MLKQQGVILIVLLVIIVLASISFTVSQLSVTELAVQRDEDTRDVLKKAKLALMAYAMNYPTTASGLSNPSQGPGNFPCPDDTLDGVSDTAVGVITPGCNSLTLGTIGRYPWSTIGTEEFKDGEGELLWYAVSSNYANQPDNVINTTTLGSINILNGDGSIRNSEATNGAVVAVIISPGKSLNREDGWVQSRSTDADRKEQKNYLDIAFSEDNSSYINFDSSDGFISGVIRDSVGEIIVNDLIVVITYEEIMDLIHAYAANEIDNLINDYFTNCAAYPEASTFDGTAPFDSAGVAPPAELREGHLPLGIVMPVDWGTGCAAGITPPQWLVDEAWDTVTYYAFAYQNAPPVNTETCGDAGLVNPPCMTVINTAPLIDNAQALIMFAGRDLTGTRPSGNMNDYFEGENNNLDDVYDANQDDDYIRVITP